MAVTKKSLTDNSASTKTTAAKSPKASLSNPLVSSKLKTTSNNSGPNRRG